MLVHLLHQLPNTKQLTETNTNTHHMYNPQQCQRNESAKRVNTFHQKIGKMGMHKTALSSMNLPKKIRKERKSNFFRTTQNPKNLSDVTKGY